MNEQKNSPNAKITYRIRYSRGHEVRYVSHLDILRLFDRAARRGNIPLSYSKGFNPHPQIVFGMPLPVGVTSEAEYADVDLDEDIGGDELIRRYNNAMPPSVRIMEASLLPPNSKNIMKAVVASKYLVDIELYDTDESIFLKEIDAFLSTNEPLIANKRTKSGTKETDIRPMIISIEGNANSKETITKLVVITAAGNEQNLRPELAVSALGEKLGHNVEVLHVHRLELINGEN